MGVIAFSEELTTVGDYAFMECATLQTITFPESVSSLGEEALSTCANLTTLYFKSTTPPALSDGVFYGLSEEAVIYVPSASRDAYKAAECWDDYAEIIKGYNFETSTPDEEEPEPEPEPEFELSQYSVPGSHNEWNTQATPMYIVGDYAVAFNVVFAEAGEFKVSGNDKWYGAKALTVGEWCEVSTSASENITIAAGIYDIYFAEERELLLAVEAGVEAPALPEVKPIVWSLAGSFNSWGDTLFVDTEVENLYVVQGVELKYGDEIKVKDSTTWEVSYGGGITNLEGNKWMKTYFNGANIVIAKSGQYDIYFEYAKSAEYSKLYLVEAGADYTVATVQESNGTLVPDEVVNPDPEQPSVLSEYGVVGSFQGWDVANPVEMYTDVDGWVVARGIELYKSDEIKIVKGKTWDVSYGLTASEVLDTDVEHTLVNENSQNIKIAKNGKFDIYFHAESLKFKYTCVEEYTNLTVDITIVNTANWNPLRLLLKSGDTLLTAAEGDLIEGNTYTVSGDYIGSTLSYQFFTDGKQSELANVTISKSGATITLEETVVNLVFKLDTDNSKQWWGTTTKIHAWNTGTSFDTSWPGNEMIYDGNYTWHIAVPSELVGKTIKFLVHTGNGWQSADSTITIQEGDNIVIGSSIGVN